ncbi:family 20 glycosylhydrolase [Chitinophaga sp. Hz27]|uniref:glycoside hydrolase family 20 protein n=1 Tax=Chitinophaga sp. Hz27 TaxID=3347169 RepID=UPI0035DDDA39
MLKQYASALALTITSALSVQAQLKPNLDIIPKPVHLQATTGNFNWNEQTKVHAAPAFKEAATLLSFSGKPLTINTTAPTKTEANYIYIQQATAAMLPDTNTYRLSITPNKITILARSRAAAINGIQSLVQLQLLQPDTYLIPCAEIEDQPRFGYRGLHLDVSRTFFPASYIKRYLDLMWLYKINTFHWHLVDGAGWRLQIKQFPALTDTAAWRYGNTWREWAKNQHRYASEGDPNAYGGYYTQDEAREIVAYAAKRGITVIPEIEMPGHAEEVLAVYPQLSCSGIPYKNNEFCLGNDQTFDFLEKVLLEVMDIFPSTYIHIGGDEANKAAWKKCPKCQQRIKSEHLKDENELQSYAIRRMEKFLTSHHRKLLGWDEILEGGLAPEATVMSWRGESGGIAAAKENHDVIMTPGAFCYFDHYQADPATQPEAQGGYLPIEKVYSYNPVPAELSAMEAKHILGAQANIWAEYIPNESHLEYMVYPRLLALSEVIWTPQEKRNFADFKTRLQSQYLLLQRLNVNYFRPSYTVTIEPKIDYQQQQTTIAMNTEQYNPVIHYTMDGSMPTANAPVYTKPFSFKGSATITAAVFQDTLLKGTPAVMRADYHKAIGKPVIYNLPYSKSYPAKKEATLTDGYRGTVSYGDGLWQGFDVKDMDVTIDMQNKEKLQSVSVNFMQLTGVGIYIPAFVEVAVSDDGVNFTQVQHIDNDVPETQNALTFKAFNFNLEGRQARYIRVKARNAQHGFLFADEVIVY